MAQRRRPFYSFLVYGSGHNSNVRVTHAILRQGAKGVAPKRTRGRARTRQNSYYKGTNAVRETPGKPIGESCIYAICPISPYQYSESYNDQLQPTPTHIRPHRSKPAQTYSRYPKRGLRRSVTTRGNRTHPTLRTTDSR